MYRIRKTLHLDQLIILNEYIFPQDPLEVDDRTVGWHVTKDDKSAGFCTMRLLDDGIAFMDRGGILSEHRGNNLHRRLIKIRERYAKRKGYKTMITYVMADNYASLFTLIRQDYKMYSPEYAYAGVKGVIYLMKEL